MEFLDPETKNAASCKSLQAHSTGLVGNSLPQWQVPFLCLRTCLLARLCLLLRPHREARLLQLRVDTCMTLSAPLRPVCGEEGQALKTG